LQPATLQLLKKMSIGLLTIELYLPLNDSLKGKRSILKPLVTRLRRDYNVSVCEADAQDVLSRAVLEAACVSQNGAVANQYLQNTYSWTTTSVPGLLQWLINHWTSPFQ